MDPNSTVNWMASVGFWIASITGALTIAHIVYTFIATINKNKLKLFVTVKLKKINTRNIQTLSHKLYKEPMWRNTSQQDEEIIYNYLEVTIFNKGTSTKYIDSVQVNMGKLKCVCIDQYEKPYTLKPEADKPFIHNYGKWNEKDYYGNIVKIKITDREGKVLSVKKKIEKE
jgi:hypothetical protein